NSYINTYLSFHSQARLGINDDRRKSHLIQDKRLNILQRLSVLDLMPSQQLISFQNRLGELKTCFALIKSELNASPKCPHCEYKPSIETSGASASMLLEHLENELDELMLSWTNILLANFEDPTIQENLELIKPNNRLLISSFIEEQKLPDEIRQDFINALQEIFSGLSKIVIRKEELPKVLSGSGVPSTISELKRRFDEYLNTLVKGKDPSKVRIMLE
ncbi:MAG: ATP-binding protein, partial [Firmicutes bacterium]|nr:ATP-binding protein [Bacillota bacterium]